MKRLDTTVKAEQIQIEIFRKMGRQRRLLSAVSLARTSRQLLDAGVRMRHPEYSSDQVRLATIKLILGDKLFASVYPEARGLRS